MANYVMEHSGEELDEAIGYVLDNYKDVTPVTARAQDVVYGKVIVTSEGPVTGTYEGVVPPESWRKTASGLTASESDGMAGWPLYGLTAEVEPVQPGSGDPAPDNVRPITGRTRARATCAGKNLLMKSSLNSSSGGVAWTANQDGSVRVVAEPGEDRDANYRYNAWRCYVPRGVPLKFTGGTANVDVLLRYVDAGGTARTPTAARSRNGGEGAYTIPADATETSIRLRARETESGFDETVYPMVRLASVSDGTWEEFAGAELTQAFPETPGTVYGGTMNFKTGVLTVTWELFTYDGTEEGWALSSSTYKRFAIPVPKPLEAFDGTAANFKGLCNIFATGTINSSNTPMNSWWYYATGEGNIYFFWDYTAWTGAGSTTLAKWKAFLADMAANGTPLTICVPLAAPVEYQLDRQQMPTLLPGANTFWCDSGDVEVGYYSVPADPTNPTVQSLQSSPVSLSMAAPTADPMDEPEEVDDE